MSVVLRPILKLLLADTIRADLLTQGVQLMDYKDAATGERRTRWEIKR